MFIKSMTLTLTVSLLFINSVEANELSFSILGLNNSNDNTKVYVQLFKGEENYQKGISHSASIVNVTKSEVVISFNNLKVGDYAVRYFHDLNNNGKMDVNLFGSPVEGYGFSNNEKPNYGPVKYHKAKFSVSSNNENVNHSTVIYGE